MSRAFVKANSDYLHRSGVVVSGYPFAFGCWVSGTDSGNVFSLGNTGDDTQYIRATLNVSTGATSFTVGGAGYVNFSSTIPGFVSGTWLYLLWVAASATDRRAYANGALIGSDTTSAPWPTGFNITALGCLHRVATIEHLGGAIAHAAFWSADPSASVADLAAGANPAAVLPASLLAYWRLAGLASPEPDAKGGTSLTVVGATAGASDPGVWAPWRAGSSVVVRMGAY